MMQTRIRRFLRSFAIISCSCTIPLAASATQPSVTVAPPDLHGSRPVETRTKQAVVRDYLQSWQSLRQALAHNQPQLLNQDFTGTARKVLGTTVAEQRSLGIHTIYRDRSHHLRIVFYSPDGLALQMIDHVDYVERIYSHGKLLATRNLSAHYLVVLTPAATRWQVRIFQQTAE